MNRMTAASRIGTALLVAVVFAGLAALPRATAREPQADADAKPKAKAKPKELIARAPFDRITLIDNTTWEVEPLSPRPLPVYDPTKRPPKKKAEVPYNGNIGLPGQKSTVKDPKQPEEDDDPPLLIHLVEGDVRDYSVKREYVKTIVYFEDMLIEEAGKLIAAGKYGKAFEYLIFVRSRQAKWPKLDEAVDRLLYEEGVQALMENDGANGLRLLGELYRRRPQYPGLGDKLASSYLQRIKKAFDVGAYATGRQVLRELESLAPDNHAVNPGGVVYEVKARERLAKG